MVERTVSVGLSAKVSGFIAGMKTAQGSVSNLTKELEKNAKRKDALLKVGNAAGLVGAAAAVGVGVAVKAAADFDKAMSGVEAATHASGKAMGDLRQLALDMGAKTAYSATEAADGIEQLSKAGVSTGDIMKGGLKGALSLAAAGEMEVGDAAEAAATAMTMFGLKGKDVPHIADLLASAAGHAQGEVSDFSYALNQSGLVANQTGLSIEETTGGLAAFASQGLLGSDAGTSFKTMLQSLNPRSALAGDLMDELGISAYDASGNFIGLTKWAGNLRSGLKGMSDEQRNSTLKTIFGSDAVRAAAVIYDEGAKGVSKWIDKVNDAGYAAETAAIKQDNLAGDLEKLKGAFDTLLIETGEGAMGPLRSITQGATNAVDALNKLPGPVKSATLAFGALVAVTGGAVFLGSRFIVAVSEARVAMTALGLTTTTTSGEMNVLSASAARARLAVRGLGLAAVAFGGYELTKFVQDFTAGEDNFRPAVDDMSMGLLGLGKASGSVQKDALPVFDDLGNAVDRLAAYSEQGFFETLGHRLVGAFNMTGPTELRGDLTALDKALVNIVQNRGPQQAEAALRDLAKAKGLDAEQTHALLSLLPRYARAMDDTERKTKDAGRATDWFADVVVDDTDAVKDETDALKDNVKAHNKRTDTLMENIDKNIAWEQSVDDATKEARQGTKTLNVNTEAGRNNLTTLGDMAAAWNDLPDKVKRAQGGIKEARQEFIRIAMQMGADREQAQKLAQQLLDIPNPKRKVEVDTQGASRDVDNFVSTMSRKLSDIDDEDVKINVKSSILQLAAQGQGPITRATGGPITGGVAGRDSVLLKAMPGEHVFTKSDVDKAGGQRAMFAIRKMIQTGEFARKGDLQYMASGGPVMHLPVREHGLAHVVDVAQAQADALSALLGKRLSAKITKMYQFGGNGRPLGPGGTLSMGQALKGQQFARSQAGKPYQWGGTGNPSWDCSGFVGGTLLASLGRSPYQRIGTTASMPWPGFSPGTGIFTTGTDPGSHMDGNVGGLGIESRGGDGVTLGSGITPISSFARTDHYDNGGVWPSGAVGVNTSGRDELVLNNEQARRFFGSAGGGRGSSSNSRGPVRVVVDMGGQTFRGMMYDAADDMLDARESHSRRMVGMH